MGLVNLLADVGTEYRKLKFGNDRPGGGNSKQPFIQQDLPPLSEETPSTFPDFLLRDPKNQIDNRKDDLERISKFLVSREGGLFVAKQELLSLQNPIVPGQPNRSKPYNGLYNPLLTLTQVGAQGTGVHVERQGLLPITNDNLKYDYVYKNKFSEKETNRLTILYNNKIEPEQLPLPLSLPQNNLESSDIEDINAARNIDLINSVLNPPPPKKGTLNISPLDEAALGISFDSNFLLSYSNGPGSNQFGFGKTNIKFASNRAYGSDLQLQIESDKNDVKNKIKDTNNKLNLSKYLGVTNKTINLSYGVPNNLINPNLNSFTFQPSVYTLGNTFPETNKQKTTDLGVYTFNQIQLINQNIIGQKDNISSTSLSSITDFRKTILSDPTSNPGAANKLYSFDYTSNKVNREQRVGLGNPGKRNRNRTKLNSYDNATVDRINILPLYKDRFVLDPDTLTRDLVKFRFEVIDNQDPGASTFVHFRAFLGTITDNFQSQWDSFKYVGRGDNLYNYQGFSRDINFTFQIAAQSRAEMRSIYQKINYLASSLAPDYRNGYMKGNLIRLTIGDYLYIVPGFISNLTYTIPDNAPWEIAFDEPEGGDSKGLMETPKYFDVNVAFTAIHDFIPRLNDGSNNPAFITPTLGKDNDGNAYLKNNKINNFNIGYNNGTFTFNTGSSQGDYIDSAELSTFATTGFINTSNANIIVAETQTPNSPISQNNELTQGSTPLFP